MKTEMLMDENRMDERYTHRSLETFINIYEGNFHTNVTEFQGEVFVDIAKLTTRDVVLQRS